MLKPEQESGQQNETAQPAWAVALLGIALLAVIGLVFLLGVRQVAEEEEPVLDPEELSEEDEETDQPRSVFPL